MAAPQYLFPGFDFALAHAVEECGEFLAAAGKTQRFGRPSVNPELAADDRAETNEAWLVRELADLRGALDRLEDRDRGRGGAAVTATIWLLAAAIVVMAIVAFACITAWLRAERALQDVRSENAALRAAARLPERAS